MLVTSDGVAIMKPDTIKPGAPERCRERLKKSREKCIDRLRLRCAAASQTRSDTSLVEDLMQEEWKVLCGEDYQQESLDPKQRCNFLLLWCENRD
ncbi:hypothetical protein LSH36_289g01010 [Paralvinella palmiformis]|uniref:Uncharacterized protein n=1 Tax=Paralvinella palmiformis TaxID=53620 RepID=A0AAD9N474_9ANNE|nr:hypothetical protein LSH36_289g01010 [Paralvinella palmiformis]